MADLKSVLWEGTDDWDELLEKRAEISGKLVLSEYTKNVIAKLKK
jgi:methylglutaconyl-CoA hydratase